MKRFLRRYRSIESIGDALLAKCPLTHGYHDAMVYIDTIDRNDADEMQLSILQFVGDPRWPLKCECGYEFVEEDERQIFSDSIYRRADTGDEMGLREAPEGGMWDATWYPDDWKGPDGRSLICVCPGGYQWHIDGRASNCTMPHDNVHRCWIRHGEPPNLTVDKNGNTCEAGGGSIQTPGWHGYLRNGILEP